MNIAVTGGSGFIASPLVRRLLQEGHHVKIIDIHPPRVSDKNLEFVKKSILDDISGDVQGCDQLFHFAALLGVDNSDKRPLETMRVNLEGSVNVFRNALAVEVKDMVYISSSEVYGQPRELPIREDSVKGPVSSYGVSKLAAEIYAQAFTKEKGANIKIVRFFNVYGSNQSPNFVVPVFILNALQQKPLRIFGDGSQVRCFTYVEDAVEGVLMVAKSGKAGEAYNIGNDQPTTIFELATIIKEVTGSTSEIIRAGFGKETRLKEREIEYRIPDIGKMRSLGWEPKVMVREGVQKVLRLAKEG